ncbi:3'-5' exonuclease [Grimontia hollisae]|uniref:DNA polymerase III epsilon subunit n=2 Tax=Grimontia hollisae TaxID=673 RepID=D0I759_GRIHO|nr:3'-5' exonuclease [Grimontia hollisae]AMG31356.1 3'-5' exonuclease [Grimontia hollisae]EEY72478.1 DNA polymerase III epsilon subunit [Grimontia hollisae CIP 101886]STO45881.1 DNA polymerase III polC-type [Grimontia hollisae]STO58062.1 DNA polymerase III polC-type [Grimontia hollisae]STQ76573.1 DNA polymerase III polC-type [Grimontia hollisae]
MLFLEPNKGAPLVEAGPDWPTLIKRLEQKAKVPLLKRFYQCGVVSGDTPVSDVQFVALDLETTGLDPSQNDIISIGLVPFTLDRIYCRDAKHWIVKPRRPLEAESVVFHGITHSDVSDAPDLRRILEEVLASLEGKIVVAHYRRIERDFLEAAVESRLGESLLFPVVDTLEIESWYYRKPIQKFWSYVLKKPLTSIRLADSRRRYNLPFYQGHNALTDAIATAELLQAQIAHRFRRDYPIKALWR